MNHFLRKFGSLFVNIFGIIYKKKDFLKHWKSVFYVLGCSCDCFVSFNLSKNLQIFQI